MNPTLRRRGTIVSIAASLVLVALTAWAAVGRSAPRVGVGPTPAELDSLARYLEPVVPLEPLDDYAHHLPAEEPAYAPPVAAAETGRAGDPDWRLNAILITSGSPVAIIDDRQVRPGERLADGTLVESISAGQVVVVAPSGERRTVRVGAGN